MTCSKCGKDSTFEETITEPRKDVYTYRAKCGKCNRLHKKFTYRVTPEDKTFINMYKDNLDKDLTELKLGYSVDLTNKVISYYMKNKLDRVKEFKFSKDSYLLRLHAIATADTTKTNVDDISELDKLAVKNISKDGKISFYNKQIALTDMLKFINDNDDAEDDKEIIVKVDYE